MSSLAAVRDLLKQNFLSQQIESASYSSSKPAKTKLVKPAIESASCDLENRKLENGGVKRRKKREEKSKILDKKNQFCGP